MNRWLRLITSSLLSTALVAVLFLPVQVDAQSRERTTGRKKTERVEKRTTKKTARDTKGTQRGNTATRSNGRTSSRTSRAATPRQKQNAQSGRTVNRDRTTRTTPSNRTVRNRDGNRTGTSRDRTVRNRTVRPPDNRDQGNRTVRDQDDRGRDNRNRTVRDQDNRSRDNRNRTVRDRDNRDRPVTSNGRVHINDRRTRDHRRDRDRYDRDRYDRDRGHRRVLPKNKWRQDRRWDRYRGGKRIRSRHAGIYIHVAPRHRVRPIIHVDVDLAWPWVYRHRYGWAPRYEYRQVVYVDVGWGQRQRNSRIDVRTVYRHRVRRATARYAEVDIYIDRLELYEDGYFIGEVDRIPGHLSRIRATIHRNGRVDFDRSVFLVGDSYVGFEMISTPHYGRYVLGGYHRGRDYQVGVVDLYEGRVVQARYSRLFDPYDFDGYVPISLLPEDQGWLWDYGPDAVSYYRYEDDYDDEGYYYGYENREPYGGPAYNRRDVQPQVLPRTQAGGRPSLQTAEVAAPVLQREQQDEVSLDLGARVKLNRTVEIRRIE